MDDVLKYHRNQSILAAMFAFFVATVGLFSERHSLPSAVFFVPALLVLLILVWVLWRKKPKKDDPRHENLKKIGGLVPVVFLVIGYTFGVLIMISKGSDFGTVTELMMPVGFYSMGLGVLAFGLSLSSLDLKTD